MKLDGTEIEFDILNSEKVLDYLTFIGYIGKVYPVFKKSKAKKIIAVLLPKLEPILDQLSYRFKLDMSESELMTFLERNNIQVLKNVDDFVKAKAEAELLGVNQEFLEGVRERYGSLLPLEAA